MAQAGRGRRLAGNALAVLLGLVALEALLQLGALALRATGRTPTIAAPGGRVRVLCLGDSNAYGLYVERREAWPQQLEALWNRSERTPPLQVLNLGLPGTSSSHLRRDLARLLDDLRPDVVMIMVGANDFWTVPVAFDEGPDAPGPGLRALRHLRLYRLAFAALRVLDSRQLEVARDEDSARETGRGTARFGATQFEVSYRRETSPAPDTRDRLEANLWALRETARLRGTRIVWLTYPSRRSFYGYANTTVRGVARDTHSPLVDLEPLFSSRCGGDARCEALFFPDAHPTAAGYRIAAQVLVQRLPDLLAPGIPEVGQRTPGRREFP